MEAQACHRHDISDEIGEKLLKVFITNPDYEWLMIDQHS
jgi:hypothetical protein